MIAYPISVSGVPTRVLESGAGAPIVLLHGLGSRADRWRGNLDGLAADGNRVLAPDFPGHGFAAKNSAFDHSVTGYREFLASFLDAMHIQKTVIIGASLGGQIGAAFAGRYPDRVGALVLVGSTGLRPFGPSSRAEIAKSITDMSRGAVRTRLERSLRNAALITDQLVEEDYRINNSPGADVVFRALARYFGERIDEDLIIEALVALRGRIPILLVWGDDDLSVSVTVAQDARRAIPGARLVVMPGTAHSPYMDKPELFNRLVGLFLEDKLNEWRGADAIVS